MADKTFSDGYTEGWQETYGSNLLPSIPSHAIPSGKTAYEHGLDLGRKEGVRRKAGSTKPQPN